MTNGSYSLYNGWVKVPDKDSIPDEYPELEPEYSEWVSRANTCSTIEDADNFLDDVYKLRQQGLLATGEYGKENLIFKELRNNGILQRLKDMKVKEQNKAMSLESLEEGKIGDFVWQALNNTDDVIGGIKKSVKDNIDSAKTKINSYVGRENLVKYILDSASSMPKSQFENYLARSWVPSSIRNDSSQLPEYLLNKMSPSNLYDLYNNIKHYITMQTKYNHIQESANGDHLEADLKALFKRKGYDITSVEVKAMIEEAAEYIRSWWEEGETDYDAEQWFMDTEMNYPEDLESLPLKEACNEGVSQSGWVDEDDLEDIRDMIYDDTGINVEVDFAGDEDSICFAPYGWEDGVEEPDALDTISDWCHDHLEQALFNAYTVTDIYYNSGCIVADIEKWEDDMMESCEKPFKEDYEDMPYSYDGFLTDEDLEDVRDMIYDDLGINVEVDFDEAADVSTLVFEPDDKDPEILDEISDWCHDNLEAALNYNYIWTAINLDSDAVRVEIEADIDESCGKKLNEAEETDTRAQELANYLGVDVDEVKNGYTDNLYEVGNEEYWVLTEDEAEEEAKAGVLSLVDDMGLQSFSLNFQDEIINNYVDEDFIMKALDDEIEYYRTQENDEETAEMLEEMDFEEAFNYFRDMFSKQDFADWVKDHIDWDAVAEAVVRLDGPENTLATYDGEEIQLDNYYAYRAN
ncbi:MAG: hypothetical protein IJH34_01415 [Romboutsia sp.]|nr:hypothetical protein [Romboutsia sp.]